MRWLSGNRMKVVLIGFVILMVVGGGNATADFAFGTPTLVPNINHGGFDYAPNISPDGLELYFSSERSIGSGYRDLWVSKRATTEDEWGVPENLGPTVNSSVYEGSPNISANGLELYFDSHRPGGTGGDDLWVSRRATTDDDWGVPENLGSTVNSPVEDYSASISSDGLELYFSSDRNGYGIWVTRRATTDEPWDSPVRLASTVNCVHPSISANGLVLLFCGWLPDGYGDTDTWVMARATTQDDWEAPVNLGPIVNSPSSEREPMLSHDGCTLYFTSNRPDGLGGLDIWQAPIMCLVDFNGDGIVHSADMCIMVDHWAENFSLCDIGPTPLGDGIVDVEDLKVLAEHFFKDVTDPTLIAHWRLDEMQGVIAYDDVTDRDGTLMGGPVWQPDGGILGGALQLDGTDDYVETDPVLNPADGVFSVVAWAQGGASGQVVVSGAMGSNWLMFNAEGKLATELQGSGRNAGGPLLSEASITDGNWHRIGFVWDGLYRRLYVDGIEVARDDAQQSALKSSGGGLYLGASSDLAPGTFFSGLIDDVRIYNRVVSP